jgi:hypothetical protein
MPKVSGIWKENGFPSVLFLKYAAACRVCSMLLSSERLLQDEFVDHRFEQLDHHELRTLFSDGQLPESMMQCVPRAGAHSSLPFALENAGSLRTWNVNRDQNTALWRVVPGQKIFGMIQYRCSQSYS